MLEFEAEAVGYAYERVAALQGLSLRVRAGERIALLGANGSGKSTLLRLMDGLHFAGRGNAALSRRGADRSRDGGRWLRAGFPAAGGDGFQNPDIQLFNPRCLTKWRLGRCNWAGAGRRFWSGCTDAGVDWGGASEGSRAVPTLRRGEETGGACFGDCAGPRRAAAGRADWALDPRSQSQVIELLETGMTGGRRSSRRRISWKYWARLSERAVVLDHGAVVADANSGRGAGRHRTAGVGEPDSLAPASARRGAAQASLALLAARTPEAVGRQAVEGEVAFPTFAKRADVGTAISARSEDAHCCLRSEIGAPASERYVHSPVIADRTSRKAVH